LLSGQKKKKYISQKFLTKFVKCAKIFNCVGVSASIDKMAQKA